MEESFVLPEYWYLKIDNDNINLITKWRLEHFNLTNDISNYYCVYNNGEKERTRRNGAWVPPLRTHDSLSSEQFIKYVLKEEVSTSIINEDLSYLIELFKKLNIQ